MEDAEEIPLKNKVGILSREINLENIFRKIRK